VRRAVLALAVASAGACKAAAVEPSGVGAWDVTRTTLADATGHCDPTDLPDGRKGTWCYMQAPLSIGGQTAQVDLYFDGVARTAPLIELQLKVPVCDLDKLESWGRTSFGAPTAHARGRTLWQNRNLFAMLAPDREGARCMLRLLPRSEAKEWARITSAP
jgi:hypothetical protein